MGLEREHKKTGRKSDLVQNKKIPCASRVIQIVGKTGEEP